MSCDLVVEKVEGMITDQHYLEFRARARTATTDRGLEAVLSFLLKFYSTPMAGFSDLGRLRVVNLFLTETMAFLAEQVVKVVSSSHEDMTAFRTSLSGRLMKYRETDTRYFGWRIQMRSGYRLLLRLKRSLVPKRNKLPSLL